MKEMSEMTHRERVLKALQSIQPASAREIAELANLEPGQVSAVLTSLKYQGLAIKAKNHKWVPGTGSENPPVETLKTTMMFAAVGFLQDATLLVRDTSNHVVYKITELIVP